MARDLLVFLDDARTGRLTLFAEPERVVEVCDAAATGPALDALDEGLRRGLHAAGYFSYELGYALEPRLAPLMPEPRTVPLLWFGLFRSKTEKPAAWIAAQTRGRASAGPLRPRLDRAAYGARFTKAKAYIAAGDAYQINLTFLADFAFTGDPLALYAELRTHAAMGFGGFVDDGARRILSFSPELFFALEGGELTARPMKGTAPRGRDAEEDRALRAALESSPKDRAENLMIVDLIRNDLGRIAATGTVRTQGMFTVESYPTVHQMVSTVRARTRDGIGARDIVTALFPCGSVTGTPKIRAQEIIRELETAPRGVYCGAVGGFSPDMSASFNVAIRTLTIEDGRGVLGIGSAVVADSDEEAEYRECLLKARFLESP